MTIRSHRSSPLSAMVHTAPLGHVANSPGLEPERLSHRPADGRGPLPRWLPEGRTLLLACARHGPCHGWRALGLPAGVAPLGFSIRVPDRDAFRLRLAGRGVESTTHWPDWLLPAGVRRRFATARSLADGLLTLPCHQGLDREDIEFACRAVTQAWRLGARGSS